MARTCWAHTLGGCDGGITGEHVLSSGLFINGFVDVVGFFAAAMLSGVLSLGINELLFRLRRKGATSKRKEVKKTAKGRTR